MLKNAPTLAIVAVDAAENEPSKVGDATCCENSAAAVEASLALAVELKVKI